MIVVDTSVLAYLLIEGDRTAASRAVLTRDPAWSAPLLWRSEFRNVLATHVRSAGMSLGGATERMAEAERLFAGREYDVASEVVLALSAASDISAYDAEFVGLARKLEVMLVTTDRQIPRGFPDTAIQPEAFAGFA